jgi:hypothetical protein
MRNFSSMSTGLNALSGVLVEDLFASYLSPDKRMLWLRVSAAISGIVCVMLVFFVQHLGGVVQASLPYIRQRLHILCLRARLVAKLRSCSAKNCYVVNCQAFEQNAYF